MLNINLKFIKLMEIYVLPLNIPISPTVLPVSGGIPSVFWAFVR